jgi:hypothetical protein
MNIEYITIPEDIVEEAADICSDDPKNSFFKIWNAGQAYKSAGMTPIYLLDQITLQLIVVAKETFLKRLH